MKMRVLFASFLHSSVYAKELSGKYIDNVAKKKMSEGDVKIKIVPLKNWSCLLQNTLRKIGLHRSIYYKE